MVYINNVFKFNISYEIYGMYVINYLVNEVGIVFMFVNVFNFVFEVYCNFIFINFYVINGFIFSGDEIILNLDVFIILMLVSVLNLL